MTDFAALGLSAPVMTALDAEGFKTATDIQACAIPALIDGRDVIGLAQTGSGKTAAFVLPMIERLLGQGTKPKPGMPRALILAPTRELAIQITDAVKALSRGTPLKNCTIFGGAPYRTQIHILKRGVDILVATPGRLMDHMKQGNIYLDEVEYFVLDEADRMLDMGFIPDVEKICECITKTHQTLFFSATMPPVIEKLTKRFLDDPKQIEVAKTSSTAQTIEQKLVTVGPRDKRKALRKLMQDEPVKNGIIFCNRKKDVNEVYSSLARHGFNVGQLHGDMDQSERMEVLRQFKANELQYLCASDVAARGLDIPDVSHVFNFDVPSHAEDYVHRIGRTGRAGRKGKAFTISTSGRTDKKFVDAIEKMIGKEIPRAGKVDLEPPKPKQAADDMPKKPFVGMGPHVPAFLARPVQMKRSRS